MQNFAFTAHYNAPKYYRELKERTPSNYLKAVIIAFGLCALVYTVVSLCGYFEFGEEVKGAHTTDCIHLLFQRFPPLLVPTMRFFTNVMC